MSDDAAPAPQPAIPYLGSWKRRRRIIYLTLGYCVLTDAYMMMFSGDTALHQQMAIAHVALAAAVIGSYVFGAAYDDHNIRLAAKD